MVANKQPLKGGSRVANLSLKFHKQSLQGEDLGSMEVPLMGYEAAIHYDIYIGNPWLFDNRIAPFAHRGNFYLDQGDGAWLWPFRETKAEMDKYISEYCPKELREIFRDKLADKEEKIDLQPYCPEFQGPRPQTKTQFLKAVRNEKILLPQGFDSFTFHMYSDWYEVILGKLCPSSPPKVDIFGSKGGRLVKGEDGKPSKLVRKPWESDWGKQFSWVMGHGRNWTAQFLRLYRTKHNALSLHQRGNTENGGSHLWAGPKQFINCLGNPFILWEPMVRLSQSPKLTNSH